MILAEFINQFVEQNSLVRILYKNDEGHEVVLGDWNDVSMDHEILNKKGKHKFFYYHNVVGLASIYTQGHYPEAINIVVERNDALLKSTTKVFKDKYDDREVYSESVTN